MDDPCGRRASAIWHPSAPPFERRVRFPENYRCLDAGRVVRCRCLTEAPPGNGPKCLRWGLRGCARSEVHPPTTVRTPEGRSPPDGYETLVRGCGRPTHWGGAVAPPGLASGARRARASAPLNARCAAHPTASKRRGPGRVEKSEPNRPEATAPPRSSPSDTDPNATPARVEMQGERSTPGPRARRQTSGGATRPWPFGRVVSSRHPNARRTPSYPRALGWAGPRPQDLVARRLPPSGGRRSLRAGVDEKGSRRDADRSRRRRQDQLRAPLARSKARHKPPIPAPRPSGRGQADVGERGTPNRHDLSPVGVTQLDGDVVTSSGPAVGLARTRGRFDRLRLAA